MLWLNTKCKPQIPVEESYPCNVQDRQHAWRYTCCRRWMSPRLAFVGLSLAPARSHGPCRVVNHPDVVNSTIHGKFVGRFVGTR
ncbi:hypothetical protein LZ30DRAFT_167769 [Colletotrichum cereale]|nr:hypothetical protein LZ30DRAFT_167769 [Colletotrichum cereale]